MSVIYLVLYFILYSSVTVTDTVLLMVRSNGLKKSRYLLKWELAVMVVMGCGSIWKTNVLESIRLFVH